MNIQCWNIRGLNQPQKQQEVARLVHALNLDVVGLVETKVKFSNQDIIKNNIFPNWNFITNSQPDFIGRIWVGWNPGKVNVSLLSCSAQMIHVKIDNPDSSISFEASFVYALHTIFDRRPLWREIKQCATSNGHLPWICLGDFNVVLSANEVFGTGPRKDLGVDEFNALVNANCLVDLRYTGAFFSWNNRRSDSE